MHIVCDDCTVTYSTLVSNYFTRKSKNPNSLDLCSFCRKKGELNPSFGKDRTEVLRYARQFQKTNGMLGNHHTIEARAKMSNSKAVAISNGTFDIKSNNRGKKSWYFSDKNNCWVYADSILELARMHELDTDINVVSWTKKHGIRIPYVYDGINRTYVPDFLIHGVTGTRHIEEVKGRMQEIDIAKEAQVKVYCEDNSIIYRLTRMKDVPNYKKLVKEMKCT
jgi:hypothetical protein